MASLTYGQLLARGRSHLREGFAVDAMLCFRQAARAEPRASDPRFHLGEVLWQLGMLPAAMTAWRDACEVDPTHAATHFALAEALLATGDAIGARDLAARVLALGADSPRRTAIHATADLLLAQGESDEDVVQRAASIALITDAMAREPSLMSISSVAGPLALMLDRLAPGNERDRLVRPVARIALASGDAATMPPLLLALICERTIAEGTAQDLAALFRAALERRYIAAEHDALRRIARAARVAGMEIALPLADCYATFCRWAFASPMPLPWPRRTAGDSVRVVALVHEASERLHEAIPAIASMPSTGFDVTFVTLGAGPKLSALKTMLDPGRRVLDAATVPDPSLAKRIAALDPDVLLDLVGLQGASGPLMAQRPAREIWSLSEPLANVLPLVDRSIPLARLPAELDCLGARIDALAKANLDAGAAAAIWVEALQAHQQGNGEQALAAYTRLLEEQPQFAPGLYLRGVACRDAGDLAGSRASLLAALEAAPDYTEARVAAADTAIRAHDYALALRLCEEGLARTPLDLDLLRMQGLAHLAQRDAASAVQSFERALMFHPTDGETHYNHGVALQMKGDAELAARAYQRTLVFEPQYVAAHFNLGVLFQQQGGNDAAIAAYEHVIRAEPRHATAYRNLGEVLFVSGRYQAWFANFARFEVNCPRSLLLAVQALEICQYSGDFTRLERYLDGLRQEQFSVNDELELTDALEQLLYLLLYFDVEPEMIHKFAQTYDATASRVYGEPLPPAETRRPGRLRLGYLSGDLRNHVLGKMIWHAVEHHDKSRFELHFYSTSPIEDDWTRRFRDLADHYQVIASMNEREAARRIMADDLDILVNLSTHTRGAKPGILAMKPARVQITHVASAGTVGLSAVDVKLTDRFADVEENQAFQIERLLPMDGCVYPYRHIAPAAEHPFHRDALGIAADTVVIGAFVSGLKLSRRCLSLWRDVLMRIPGAKLAFSPLDPAMRPLYLRIAAAADIASNRLIFVPQGRDDAQNQARYNLVDFVLDPMPYGGANGTLEALDSGVPVVTLVGKKHSERTSYSILKNLGVEQTIAQSGRDYVDIAVRLAQDSSFMQEVRDAIRSNLASSALSDMRRHTRHLESAYLAALALQA